MSTMVYSLTRNFEFRTLNVWAMESIFFSNITCGYARYKMVLSEKQEHFNNFCEYCRPQGDALWFMGLKQVNTQNNTILSTTLEICSKREFSKSCLQHQ